MDVMLTCGCRSTAMLALVFRELRQGAAWFRWQLTASFTDSRRGSRHRRHLRGVEAICPLPVCLKGEVLVLRNIDTTWAPLSQRRPESGTNRRMSQKRPFSSSTKSCTLHSYLQLRRDAVPRVGNVQDDEINLEQTSAHLGSTFALAEPPPVSGGLGRLAHTSVSFRVSG